MVSTDQDSFEERPRICQAQGCEVNVNPFGRYCRKRRLCPEHLKAPSLRRKKYGDEKWRFCQQCGKLELIKNFDGLKRSCRVQLARRRAANTHKGERRRSNATEPSRSADNRSSSGAASPSQDDAQLGNGDYTSSGHDGDPAQQPSAAAAAAAAGNLPGSAAIASGGVESRQVPAAAEASDTAAAAAAFAAAAGGCSSDYQRAEGRADMSLASYMQYGLESALLLGQQPAAQQPHQGQQQQQPPPGPLLPSQPDERALFSLQQQQQRDAAVLQEHIDMSLAEQLQCQQQQHQRARGTAHTAASAGCFPPPSSAALAAGPNMQSSSSDLLLQLLREQQLRSWQQLQPAGLLSHPQLLEHHHDVYTMALDTGIGNSTGLGSANAGAAIKGQSQQLSAQQQQQQQQSISQHSLQPQRQSLESQTYTGAAARSGSSGSFHAGSAAAAEAPFLGLDSSVLRPGVIKHEIIDGQQQYVPSSFADALPHASFAMLQDMGRGVPQSGFQQQQLMQQPQADPFQDPTYNSQPGWPRSSMGLKSDYQAVEDLLIAGMPTQLLASNLRNQDDSSGPSNLRSLSALEGCNSFGPIGTRQPPLRGIDSAPPQLGSLGGAAAAGACAATSSIHSSSSGTSYLTIPGMQGGQPGRSTAGQLPSSTSAPVAPALSGPMTLYPGSADAAGVGGVAVSGPQLEAYWPAAATSQGAQGIDPYRQQPLQCMEYPGGNLWAPAGADAIKQQQAELQAIFDGASAAAAAAAAAGVGGQMPWPNPGMQDQPFRGNMQGQ